MYAERGFFRACPPFASSVESASFFPAFFFEDFFSSYFCDLSAGTAFMEAFAAPLEALEAFFPLCWSSGLRSPSFFNFELSPAWAPSKTSARSLKNLEARSEASLS